MKKETKKEIAGYGFLAGIFGFLLCMEGLATMTFWEFIAGGVLGAIGFFVGTIVCLSVDDNEPWHVKIDR